MPSRWRVRLLTSGALSQKPSVPFASGRSVLCTERTGKIRKDLVITGSEKIRFFLKIFEFFKLFRVLH